MKKAVLVLTNTEDGAHSEVVISKLRAGGERVFRMNSDRISTGALKIKLVADSRDTNFVFEDNGDRLVSEEIGSVWYRRPNHFNLSIRDPVQKAYAEREITSLLEGLWTLVSPEVVWVSKPSALEAGRKKVNQLKLGREMGLRIPRTVVSNDPAEVRSFYEDCGGKMIFKAIYHEFLNYGDKAFNIPTTLIQPQHLDRLDLVRNMPALFQEFIEKRYEFRVTVVGEQVFAVKIDSQSNPLTVVDWRNPACINDLSYSVAELPGGVTDVCIEMLRRLDLAFGAFDFVVSTAGELYFLEVNPNGQWYWLEHQTGVLISDAIVDTLKQGRG